MIKNGMQLLHFNRLSALLLVYVFYLGAVTLSPYDFSMAAVGDGAWALESRSSADIVLNIFGFIPLGVMLYFVSQPYSKKMIWKCGLVVGSAALLSFSIETGQMFLRSRDASLVDLLTNTIGGGLGFWMADYLVRGSWVVRLKRYRRKIAIFALIGYLGYLVLFLWWSFTPQKLESWDPSYPFLVGNELTMDRPWRGKIFVLALYDRVLTTEEIGLQFRAGPHFEAGSYLGGGPIVLYAFREARGTRVHDRSVVGSPLDLEIADPHKAAWLPMGGLELSGPNVLRSIESAEKIHHHFTTTNSFSLAAWVEPKDAMQAGPARIASFSRNPSLRNFTLGQVGSEIHLRVRNRLAGLNGSRVNLRTEGLRLRSKPTHLVAIYDRGIEQLYVDGVLFHSLARQDAPVTFLAATLHFDVGSYWQRGLLILLLLGPVAGCCLLLRGSQLIK